VPIVDWENRLAGIISESDLINEARRRAAIPRLALFGLYALPEPQLLEAYRDGWHLTAADLMSRKLITASEDATLEDLSCLMLQKRINRVPILRAGKLVGIVTREDVLRGMTPPARCEPEHA